ncbi:NIPSNAP protein [Plasticicumulans lactativorans]|uniref:NIPSNAP protein n=1 Tax=Plasticicumulans lactativorans TaxID=1133106 RepID=A0A4R2L420_9GAMM|nr:NIPSNAP family protein [Plasticicumulans lactativorans]TCO81166.1 NIPSNAP protein [Plasticicumulans lactativorans]
MKRYELITLTFPIVALAQALPRLRDQLTAPEAGGTLLGCWTSDIGTLNQVLVLRGYADAAALDAERERVLLAADPFGVAELLSDMRIETFAPFPFMPPIQPGEYGRFYELRSYQLKHGELAPTIEAWRDAVGPRSAFSPLLGAMYALDGTTPRIFHLWPYQSLDARLQLRSDSVAQGAWPPKGGPARLLAMHSTIGLPTAFSPLK